MIPHAFLTENDSTNNFNKHKARLATADDLNRNEFALNMTRGRQLMTWNRLVQEGRKIGTLTNF